MSAAKRNWTIQSHRLWSHQQIKLPFLSLLMWALLIDIRIDAGAMAKELDEIMDRLVIDGAYGL